MATRVVVSDDFWPVVNFDEASCKGQTKIANCSKLYTCMCTS